ncbi:DUF7507 domain-containing protein [Micromonosporaceae bacterium Da 78-11]
MREVSVEIITKHRRAVLTRMAAIVAMAAIVVAVSLAVPLRQTAARAAPSTCAAPVALTNGDFELPIITNGTVKIMSQTLVPGWLTTATDKMIELWRGYNGVSEGSGSQHAELNANQVSTLYQDLTTTPGQTLRWELKHRGRSGVDTMAVMIGPPAGLLLQQGPNIADGNTAWGTYSGIYTVPIGQTSTRFAFKSVASASPNASVGNFLDAISFGSAACLVTTNAVTNATTANVGDVLTYTVTTRNDGGNPAQLTELSDTVPVGTTFVPGSIRTINGSTSTKVTDVGSDDTGEYDSGTQKITVRTGTGATTSVGGALPSGESRSFSYQVKVNSAAAETTISDDATAVFTDTLGNSRPTSTSNLVSTAVNAAADLSVAATLTSPSLTAGTTVTYQVTGANAGPSTAGTVRLTADVPAGLTSVTANSTGGTCNVIGSTATCDYPTLAAADTRTMTITGAIPAGATPGAIYTVGAGITAATYETNSTDNTASLSKALATSADLAVTLTAPATAVYGTVTNYTATVTNVSGPSVARNISLADPLPANATSPTASVPGGTCTYVTTARTIDCSLPDLAPGDTATVSISFTPAGSGGAAINNAVSVTSSTPDPAVADNNYSVQSAGTATADLGVDLEILNVTTVKPGDTVNYRLSVTNNGPSPAYGVSFNTVAPPGLTIQRDLTNPYCTSTGCTLPMLPAHYTQQFVGQARIEAYAAAGLGFASTTVVSPTTDNNSANDTDTVSLTVSLDSDLSVAQTLTTPDHPGTAVAGEHLSGTVTVTNNGPTRADGVVLQKNIPAGEIIPTTSAGAGSCDFQGAGTAGGVTPDGGNYVCSLTTLATGATWTISFTGAIPAGFAADSLTRTAVVSSAAPDADPSNNSVTTTLVVEHVADLVVTQSTGTPNVVQTDPVAFRVTVRNDGPSEVQPTVQEQPGAGVVVSGGTPGLGTYSTADGSWQLPLLAVGGSAILDLTGIAQNAGTVVNTAYVRSSADFDDPTAANDSASASVTVTPSASSLSITVTPTVDPVADQNAAQVGDHIDYRYDVVNTGNLSMSQITVDDALLGSANCHGVTTLAVGASMACDSARYTVTQADVDAGRTIDSMASVTALPHLATDPSTFGPALAAVPVVAATVTMTISSAATVSPAGHQNAAEAGDHIGYAYLVTNTGNVTMDDVTVAGATCLSTTLAPHASTTCAAVTAYQVSQADIDASTPIVTTASVTAKLHGTTTVSTFGPATATVPVATAGPALTAAVTAAVDPVARQGAAAAGDHIDHSYLITNNGNVTMTAVAVTDPLVGPVTCPATPVAPGATLTCAATGRYPVTQADINAGLAITDAATVTGRQAGTATVSTFGPFSAAVGVAPAQPSLTVTINPVVTPTAHQNAVRLHDTIAYDYLVANNGNVTMDQIGVTDAHAGTITCPSAAVAPGTTATCTATTPYPVTQQDVDAGLPISGTATVAGRAPGASIATSFPSVTATVPVAVAVPSLTVSVTPTVSNPTHQHAAAAGDSIGYLFTVTNNGNATMDTISVIDSRVGAATCVAATLAIGAQTTCATSVRLTVTQAYVDAGSAITDSATAYGRSPGGITPAAYGPGTASVPVAVGHPVLTVVVTPTVADPAHQGAAAAGDDITYRYRVTNSGNLTMGTITVGGALSGVALCPSPALAVGDRMDCTGGNAYRVTQADVDAGLPVTDTAYASAARPGSNVVLSYGPGTATVAVAPAAPALSVQVVPTVRPARHQNAAGAGDTITYQYVVTNTGNVTTDRLTVADSLLGAAVCASTPLAPGASVTCAATRPYQVTQGDVDAGLAIIDTATVSGRIVGSGTGSTSGPAVGSVPVTASNASVVLTVLPEVVTGGTASVDTVTASVDTVTASAAAADGSPAAGDGSPAAGDGSPAAGDRIRYRYRATNDGNVTMNDLTVSDALVGAVTCAATSLPEGASTSCAADRLYTVTQADVDAGRPISNGATITGRFAGASAPLVYGPVSVDVAVTPAAPRIGAQQTAVWEDTDGDGLFGTADTIISTIVVTNTGNVTLIGLQITGLPAKVNCTSTRVAPGASVTCVSGAYHLTAADLAGGHHTYIATVTSGTTAGQDGVDTTAPTTINAPTATPTPTTAPTTSPTAPSASPTVSPSPSDGDVDATPLPTTGSDIVAAMGMGLALILGGFVLLVVTRRRATKA